MIGLIVKGVQWGITQWLAIHVHIFAWYTLSTLRVVIPSNLITAERHSIGIPAGTRLLSVFYVKLRRLPVHGPCQHSYLGGVIKSYSENWMWHDVIYTSSYWQFNGDLLLNVFISIRLLLKICKISLSDFHTACYFDRRLWTSIDGTGIKNYIIFSEF